MNAINEQKTHSIGIFKTHDTLKFSFYGIQEYFEFANNHSGKELFQTEILEWDESQTSVTSRNTLDCLIFPPLKNGSYPPELPVSICHAIRDLHKKGTIIASVCAGSFLIAQTGILDHLEATTHWKLKTIFEQKFPQIKLNCDKILIQQGNIVTAGGLSAWADLCIYLTAQLASPRLAQEMSRMFLVDTGPREQKYYSYFSPTTNHGDTEILRCQHWLEKTISEPFDYQKLAEISKLGIRTLQRRFKTSTGYSITEYLQNSRIQKARYLLEESNLTVENIVWEVGYEDIPSFGKLFKRLVGLSPSAYRKRFRLLNQN